MRATVGRGSTGLRNSAEHVSYWGRFCFQSNEPLSTSYLWPPQVVADVSSSARSFQKLLYLPKLGLQLPPILSETIRFDLDPLVFLLEPRRCDPPFSEFVFWCPDRGNRSRTDVSALIELNILSLSGGEWDAEPHAFLRRRIHAGRVKVAEEDKDEIPRGTSVTVHMCLT